MHVTTSDISSPVALIEHRYVVKGEPKCLRVLVFREGLLTRPVINLLGRLMAHV